MRISSMLPTVLLLFLLFAAPSTAEIKSVKIRSDNRYQIPFDYFKFTNTGHVSVAVSSVSVTSLPVTSNISRPDPSRFGFYLVSEESDYQFRYSNISCALDTKYISLLFTFKEFHISSSFNKSFLVTSPNEYTLYFANCNWFSHLTMDVRTELYNMDNNGTTKDYLSAGMTKLPGLYFILSLIYICFLGIWMFVCFKYHKSFHIRVHLFMAVLLVTKAISLLCVGEVQHSVKVTGIRPHVWDVSFYIFQFITRAVLYTVIGVIFDGFSFLKFKTKMFFMFVIPLQVLETILFKMKGVLTGFHTGIKLSNIGLQMVDSLLCVIIIMFIAIPMCGTRKTGDYTTHLLLWRFFLVVVVYLFTNFIVVVYNNFYYNYHWECNAAEEIISLVFYMVMFYMFRPFEKYGYFLQLKKGSVVPTEGV